jgi:hypothetical protein
VKNEASGSQSKVHARNNALANGLLTDMEPPILSLGFRLRVPQPSFAIWAALSRRNSTKRHRNLLTDSRCVTVNSPHKFELPGIAFQGDFLNAFVVLLRESQP